MSNMLLATDAYKGSHFLQYPKDSEGARFYIAPRKPASAFEREFITFGLSYFVDRYLRKPITHKDIDDAMKVWSVFNVMGTPYPFPESGFRKIVDNYNGHLPINIYGVPEGTVLSTYNEPIAFVEVLDPEFVWVPGMIETAFQRCVWYASTVATLSRNTKKMIKSHFDNSVDAENYWMLDFKLHDFGARGATSGEAAALGGLSHLINFKGTDTMEAVELGVMSYNIKPSDLACSIPASEHSTVTSWGQSFEEEKIALKNMIDNFGGGLFAFVSDSYDYKRMVDQGWGSEEVKELIRAKGGAGVVRPDSGDPVEMVVYALKSLEKSWGVTVNGKGFKVLTGISVIQGDGLTPADIDKILTAVEKEGFSAQNVTFGMGGGLLQKLDRDTMSWSMKMCAIKRNGKWLSVQKKPVTQKLKLAWDPSTKVYMAGWVTYWRGSKQESDCQSLHFAENDFAKIRSRAEVV